MISTHLEYGRGCRLQCVQEGEVMAQIKVASIAFSVIVCHIILMVRVVLEQHLHDRTVTFIQYQQLRQ